MSKTKQKLIFQTISSNDSPESGIAHGHSLKLGILSERANSAWAKERIPNHGQQSTLARSDPVWYDSRQSSIIFKILVKARSHPVTTLARSDFVWCDRRQNFKVFSKVLWKPVPVPWQPWQDLMLFDVTAAQINDLLEAFLGGEGKETKKVACSR